MYNKYFTMKKSELKEAIKNEITSVLLEGMSDEERENRIQHLMRTGAKEKPLRKLAAIGKKEDEDSLKEVYQTNSKMSQIVSLFQDMMDDEYDGIDYRKALNDVLKAIDDDYKAAEREGEKFLNVREGTWSLGKASDINIILSQLQDLSKKAYNIIGDDEFYNGIDAAITRAEELMMNAPLNEEKEEEDDDKAASKSAKKEKLGKQASKLSQADEDRYERIKNGLEKLKKKGDEESIKKMKAILGKKEVEELIKAKGRTKASFM